MSDRRARRLVPLVTLVALTLNSLAGARAASADDSASTPEHAATANALFYEAKRLSAAGQVDEACDKLEVSMALHPRLGVQLYLAACYEQIGRTASAWLLFGEAAAAAQRISDPREAFARQRVARLASKLSRVVITISATDHREGLKVERDAVVVPPAAYGLPVAVDPGEHVVVASEPGRRAWSTKFTVARDGEMVRVTIPELEPVPVVHPVPMARSATSGGERHMTAASWTVGGVAAAGIVVGTYAGVTAWSLARRARTGCDPANHCSEQGYEDAMRSRRYGTISSAAFAVAGGALVSGIALYLVSPNPPDARLHVVPSTSVGSVGMMIDGRF